MSKAKTRAGLFPDTDTPLREDVRTLGKLVGWVLREQVGGSFFHDVEAARTAAIRRRVADVNDLEELEEILSGKEPNEAEDLARAFSTYFQVVNLAEEAHRLRRRRDYLRADAVQSHSLLDAVRQLRGQGLGFEEARGVLSRLAIEPVFTAHPTEAKRRTLLRKEQRIARLLVDRMDPSQTPPEARAVLEKIRVEISAGWQTEEHASVRRTVADEREHVLFFLTDIFYRIVPPFYEAVDDSLEEVYGERPSEPLPTVLRFASWVGGDMDGNPNVHAETIRETLGRQRTLILQRYLKELNDLYGQLSQTLDCIGFDEELLRRTADGDDEIPARHQRMPYRVFLKQIYRRLERTLNDEAGGYDGAAELLDDLRLIADSLAGSRGHYAGLFFVRRLERRVETFGFHLATLDVRQDAEVHRRVVGHLLGADDWLDLSAAARTARLQRILTDGESMAVAPDDAAETTLEVFRAIRESRRRYGKGAIGPYIISMAQGADDVLSVLVLARWAGLANSDGEVPLDVAPLFETVPDLEAAGGVMSALLEDPLYRAHVRRRGDRQMVMIGYSDSNKDGGLAASRWALYRGQESLLEALAPTGVELTVFHGRGGTVSRGGGKITSAVKALPAGALGSGRLRLTEQGETINAKYGLRGIALRTLEQTSSAVVLAAQASSAASSGTDPEDLEVMNTIAERSRAAYRGLVYETPTFYEYFRQATPVDVIERLRIGSRPASRRQRRGIGNLRAIPWVFAWMQSRHVLPGWYGLGTGLEAAVEAHGKKAVAHRARCWPFLRVLLDDAEMVLAKADLEIAACYAELAEGEGAKEIFGRIRSEFELTVRMILEVKGNRALLDDDPMLQRSIELRNPYIDPMSLLQVDLLRRWRDTDREDDDLLRALVATINGIAQGLRNTG